VFGGRAYKLFSIGGIPVRVDASWIWIALLVVYSLIVQYTDNYGMDQGQAIGLALFTAFLFFGSILIHELSHAFVARLRNVEVSSITLYFFGGATATRLEDKPGDQFLISFAGPVASLLVGGLFWWIANSTEGSLTAISFGYVGWINLVLAVFNLVPGYPLDGGQMLRAAVWRVTGNEITATKVAAIGGFVVGGGLIVFGALGLMRGDVGGGIWLAVIGWFLIQNAQVATRRTRLRAALAGATVQQAMGPPPSTVPAEMPLSEVLDRYLREREHEAFPVVDGLGSVIGLLTFDSASEVGQVDPFRPAREAMVPLDQVAAVPPTMPLSDAIQRLGPTGAALVLHGRTLQGAITAADIERWAAAQSAA
jgi:Zn-dependent protease